LLEIDVADTGIGIAPDRIGRIFDSFSQADNGIARQFGGTGLGLTICSMLAEQMGGGISVRSEIGHGSVFTLRVVMPHAEVIAPEAAVRPTPTLRPGLRIMVAEDNRTNMMILRKLLKGQVAALIEAENGEEAFQLYQDNPPDMVLMDVSMPVKDGLQATRDIRALEGARGLKRCPVVALTANAFGEDRAACRVAGLDGFLVKPLSRGDLLAEIEAHCPPDSAGKRAMGL
jgi:CheY-like chemotaxis protein